MTDNKGINRLLNAMADTTVDACREIVTAGEAGHDELHDGTNIWEYPLEVIHELGKPYTVVLGTGGPHIEVTADGHNTARVECYWGSERATRYDNDDQILSRFLDLYIPERNN